LAAIARPYLMARALNKIARDWIATAKRDCTASSEPEATSTGIDVHQSGLFRLPAAGVADHASVAARTAIRSLLASVFSY
jgi:hypothetical protein